jgi:hypothetical protein
MRRLASPILLSVALALAAALGGCLTSDATSIDDYDCPPGGTALTYQNFGEDFLGSNCETCHASEAVNRHGAPEAYTFDTVDEVRDHAARIFANAAADNTSMPPGPDDTPSDARDRLAEWLACGAP